MVLLSWFVLKHNCLNINLAAESFGHLEATSQAVWRHVAIFNSCLAYICTFVHGCHGPPLYWHCVITFCPWNSTMVMLIRKCHNLHQRSGDSKWVKWLDIMNTKNTTATSLNSAWLLSQHYGQSSRIPSINTVVSTIYLCCLHVCNYALIT